MLSFGDLGDLFSKAGILLGPVGDTRLQVETFFPARTQFTSLILVIGALLDPMVGCHTSRAPDVVATVDGKDILRSDLERQYLIVKVSQGGSPQDPSLEQAGIARLIILDRMIDDEILQQQAAKLNVVASDEDVTAVLTEQKLPYTKEEFDKQLKEHNETLEDYKRAIRQSLTVSKLMNKEIDSKINITDAEITGFYHAHKADFNILEPRYHIARIVVFNVPSPQTTNLQNNKATREIGARNKIEALHQKLENGEDFDALATSFSEDKDSASNGGNTVFVPESQLSEEVYNAFTKLKPGQFTEVLPISGGPIPNSKPIGYAIYRLLSRDAVGQRTLNDARVQAAIRQKLRDGRGQLHRNAYFRMIRAEAKVHNYLADQILRDGAK